MKQVANTMPYILVVDDDPLVSEMIALTLRRADLIAQSADNGREAYAKIMRQKPDMIILDINMPEMDGHTLLRKLKTSKKWHDIPILMLTAETASNEIAQTLHEGAVDYMIKPSTPEQVALRAKDILFRGNRTVANNDDARIMQLLEEEYSYGGHHV